MAGVVLHPGSQKIELTVPAGKLVQGRRVQQSTILGDVRLAIAASLESPIEFPALRQALTPDDHIAIILHEEMNGIAEAMEAVLSHILTANVPMNQVTVLVQPRLSGVVPTWMDTLPATCQGFQLEVHDREKSKMAYLASTKEGRRIYLNRHIVDADQIVIVGNVRFDAVYGISNGLAELFPDYSDLATYQELTRHLHANVTGSEKAFPIWKEAEAVGWLLGLPFVVCVGEGPAGSVKHVFAGAAGHVRQQAEAWIRAEGVVHLPYQVDLVIGTLAAAASQQSFAQIAEAAFRASRAAHQGGRVAILTEASGALPAGADIISQSETVVQGLSHIRQQHTAPVQPWWYLAHALEHAKVYTSSHLLSEVIESLFVVPFDQPGQVQHLIDQAKSVVIIEGIDRSAVEVGKSVAATSN